MNLLSHLFEEGTTDSNCNRCANDEEYYIPISIRDMLNLRLKIPYSDILANGGGMPVGANVTLTVTDATGSIIIANDFGNSLSGRWTLGNYNNPLKKVAQYQIFAPIGVGNSPLFANSYRFIYFNANDGDYVTIIGLGSITFVVGSGMPEWVYRVNNSQIAVAIPALSSTGVIINGNSIIASYIWSNLLTLQLVNTCFRYMISVNYINAGIVKNYYTKPFKIYEYMCDTPTIAISGTSPLDAMDCIGYVQQASGMGNIILPNRVFYRIYGGVSNLPALVKKEFNAKFYTFRSSLTKQYQLKSPPMPEWSAEYVEGIFSMRDTCVKNIKVNTNSNNISENVSFPSSLYRFIDISLQDKECEQVFSC